MSSGSTSAMQNAVERCCFPVRSCPVPRIVRLSRALVWAVALAAAAPAVAWTPAVARAVAWRAVQFFPPDLAAQVKKNHRAFDRGIAEGLASLRGENGRLAVALAPSLEERVRLCVLDLRKPVPLVQLVEELGRLGVWAANANDPLATGSGDPREPSYRVGYERYVETILPRVEMVYYGQDPRIVRRGDVDLFVRGIVERSRSWYPAIGEEFYRTGRLRDWRTFDDRSVAFGVAGVALSHALTDFANLAAYIWGAGGGLVPTPLPTPRGHVGPTITVGLSGGFPERRHRQSGAPAMPTSRIKLPPP